MMTPNKAVMPKITRFWLVSPELFRKFEPMLLRITYNVRERLAIYAQYEWEKRNSLLNSLKHEFFEIRDKKSLLESMARHLPGIGN